MLCRSMLGSWESGACTHPQALFAGVAASPLADCTRQKKKASRPTSGRVHQNCPMLLKFQQRFCTARFTCRIYFHQKLQVSEKKRAPQQVNSRATSRNQMIHNHLRCSAQGSNASFSALNTLLFSLSSVIVDSLITPAHQESRYHRPLAMHEVLALPAPSSASLPCSSLMASI